MLTEQINWNELRASVSYVESDSLAVLRPERNTLHFHPVFLQESTGDAFVRIEGRWVPVRELRKFERYQKLGRKKLLDTSTQALLEV